LKLHHLALSARNVDRVAAFYRDAFNLAETARNHRPDGSLRSIWLDLGGPILMIEGIDDEPRDGREGTSGLFLIALRVEPERRAELERVLEAMGAPVESRTSFTSYARDPEGNRVAISHYPHCSAMG
jgi:glyoxylase I family protein